MKPAINMPFSKIPDAQHRGGKDRTSTLVPADLGDTEESCGEGSVGQENTGPSTMESATAVKG
jgi:hypothetical protein